MSGSVLVRSYPLGGQAEAIGADTARGITIEGLQVGVDDWGPRELAGTLKRDPTVPFGDLGAATPLEVEFDGTLLWSGRVKETPTAEVERQISLAGEGWQYHLDDDDYRRDYVLTDLSRWTDYRSSAQADLTASTAAGVMSQDTGGVAITIPANQTLLNTKQGGGVFIDLGPDYPTGGKIAIDYTTANTAAGITAILSFATTINGLATAGASLNIVSLNGTFGTNNLTWAGAFRYIGIFLVSNTGGNQTPANDAWFKASGIRIFGSTAWESGLQSILKATDVIKDALTHAPLIGTDVSLVQSTSFNIPDFKMDSYATPRETMQTANAYHNYQMRIRADRRPEYRPRPTAPVLMNFNGKFNDQSAGTLDQIYNRVVAQATGADGVQIISGQTLSPDTTIPGRRGFYRTTNLQTNMALTQAALDQIAQTYLSAHTRTPFKGTLTVVGERDVRMMVGGAYVQSWMLLQYVGEMIHFPNLVDPDTGAKGRDGRIAAVTYDHDSRTASVSIDSTRSNFEALLARLAIVTGRVA